MSRNTRIGLFFLVLGLAGAAGGFLTGRLLDRDRHSPNLSEQPVGLAEVGSRRPDFRLPDLNGVVREVQEWDGQVLVVNFWATWCPPCRREMPDFIALQAQYGERGLQFVGIAIDERAAVADFVQELGVNYPTLIGQADAMEVGQRLGNTMGALPYTVIVDRQGVLVFAKRGELSREQAEEVILSLL